MVPGYHPCMSHSDTKAEDFNRTQLRAVESREFKLNEELAELRVKASVYRDLLTKLGADSQMTRDLELNYGPSEIKYSKKPITDSASMMRALESLINDNPGIDAATAGDIIEPQVEPWSDTRSARKLITDKLFELTRSNRARRDDHGRYWPVG